MISSEPTKSLLKLNTLRCACVAALMLGSFAIAIAQSRGTISGQVVTEDGGVLPNVSVNIFAYSSNRLPGVRRTTTTDEDGKFQFTNLLPQSYMLFVIGAKGYVPAPTPPADRDRRYYRLGDSVTLTMIRGGVITGRVTHANGDPVIGVFVSAIRVRDQEGNKFSLQGGSQSRATDDRGVYRIYGLLPGTFIVAANGGAYASSPMAMYSPYQGESPTYHPSATRDTAAEVPVVAGGEASGIDIRYRGEPGHTISGKVLGGGDAGATNYGASISLMHTSTGTSFGNTYVQQSAGENSFAFTGVPDGEYELTATRFEASGETAFRSEPRRVTVKGADAVGTELRLAPLASLAGRLVIEAAPNVCDAKLKSTLGEVVVIPRRDEKASNDSASATRLFAPTVAVNEKGEFTLNGIPHGRYRLESNLPNENWFVKSILLSTAAPVRRPATSAPSVTSSANDIARSGVALKSGEKVSGLIITVADGAASLRGKVAAKEGIKLPPRLRVHLLPAEPASADDVARYAELPARADGTFSFSNLAPGKYWLLARAVPEEEPVDRPALPAAWDAVERAKLRKEAEAAKNEIELKACQRATGQAVQYSRAAK